MSETGSKNSPTGNQSIYFSGEVIALALDLKDGIIELSRILDDPDQVEILAFMLKKVRRLHQHALEHQDWAKQNHGPPRKKMGG